MAVNGYSGGEYIEWRLDDSLLYFEVDEESVLSYIRTPRRTETIEDSGFDVDKAKQTVMDFLQNAA